MPMSPLPNHLDEPPARFEAGTPAFVQAIGLGAALNYMQNLGLENITAHETELTAYAIEAFKTLKGITFGRYGAG